MSKIFLIGFMGSGKTTLGKQLAELMNIEFIDLDKFIEENEAITITEIFSSKGEEYFREKESFYLRSLNKITNAVVATGGGAPCYFENMKWMNENGTTVYLKADSKTLLQRLKRELNHRPLLINKSEEELKEFIHEKLIERELFYSLSQVTVPSSISPADLVAHLSSIR